MNFKFDKEKLTFDLNKKLIIIGCGGHSKVVSDIAVALGFQNIIYLDKDKKRDLFLGKKIYHKISENFQDYFFVAIGDNFIREQLYNDFQKKNKSAESINLIHPSSFISSNTSIGFGNVIMPLCVINSNTKIKNGTIINSKSSVDHDNNIMSFASLAPGVITGGNVSIGERSAICIGSVIKNDIRIESDVVVGASSMVNKNLGKNIVVFGTPAKFVRTRAKGDKYL